MGLRRTIVHEYAAAPEAVLAILLDGEFLRRRAEQSGERNVEISVERTLDGGANIRLARDLVVELPRMFRRIYRPTQRVIEEASWFRQGDVWEASFIVYGTTAPGKVRGSIRLAPTPVGSSYESCFEVLSPLPFSSDTLEGLVADRVEDVMRAMLRGTAQELALEPPAACRPRCGA